MENADKFPIPNFSRFYITKTGHVFRHNPKRVPNFEKRKLTKGTYGFSVGIVSDSGDNKTFMVHKLMAMTFGDLSDKKVRITHLDENVYNNDFDNLLITPTGKSIICACNCHKNPIDE